MLILIYHYKGKSFICQTILAAVRMNGHIALPCASSGIAATNFIGGRTAHSRFKIPIKISNTSTCNLTPKSAKFKLIRDAKILIWDEAPMQRRWVMECVDRTLRALLDCKEPFGGKVVVFCGDFRQVAPVIPRAGRQQIVSQSLTMSKLWSKFELLKLTINERINQNKNIIQKQRQKVFADFLLDIGNGTYSNKDGLIKIPKQINCSYDSISSFIGGVFGKLCNYDPNSINSKLLNNAILTPKNKSVKKINNVAIQQFKGELKTYESIDTLELDEQSCNYPVEYLNSLEINGIPDFELHLKVGVPVMVLRNIDPMNGVCNGTKGIVTAMDNHVIQIAIKINNNDDVKYVYIPRISLIPSDPQIPIKFKRHQFPIRLAFAMTINKSQGQTLNNIGLYLPEPVFGHGQLYVAFSRVRDFKNIKMLIIDGPDQGKWDGDIYHTKNVVYQEMLTSLETIPINNISYLIEYESDLDTDDTDFDIEMNNNETFLVSDDEFDDTDIDGMSDNDNNNAEIDDIIL